MACGQCLEGNGWQTIEPPDFGVPAVVRPCPTCRPEQFALWRLGAFSPKTSARTSP